jgi:DNA-binding NarL/FixJ family response regulator
MPEPYDAEAHPVRVIVVDDQLLLREGIAVLLARDPHIQVVGQAGNGQEAIDLVGEVRPVIALMDMRMPVLDGIQATREIKRRFPEVCVIILTSFPHDGYVIEGLKAGADGYLLKDASPAALVSGIRAVAAGQQVIEPGISRRMAEMLSGQNGDLANWYDGLTPRELQMVAMIGRGLAAKDIARELLISEKTVRSHISNIYQKLGIFDRSQAVLYAIKKGLVAAE